MQKEYEENVWDRWEAGVRLGWKILMHDLKDAVVVGIPAGGVVVAAAASEVLNLPLEVLPCREVFAPGDNSRSIGSICENASVFHDQYHDTPQSITYFQTVRLRNEIDFENRFYYGDNVVRDFRYKTVILVTDMLSSADAILACIEGVRKHKPLKIIVAVPLVEAEAARVVNALCDEFIFLKMQSREFRPADFYEKLESVDDWKVRELLLASKHLPQLRPASELVMLNQFS